LVSIAAVTLKSVTIHPEALKEAEAATAWYAERSHRAATEFLNEISDAIDRLTKQPLQCPEFTFGTRRALLHKFPYAIVFRETATDIEIVAIAHGRRRPGYWRKRI
jgi:plasmid stabilization system protein ParE